MTAAAVATPGFWEVAGNVSHLLGACIAAIAVLVLFGRRARFGPAGDALMASLAATAIWCVIAASHGDGSVLAGFAEAARNFAYLFAIYRLFASDGRHASVTPVRPVLLALGFVELLQVALLVAAGQLVLTVGMSNLLFHFNVMFRLLVVVGGLVLVHNLYVGAAQHARLALRWPALALTVMWGLDLNLYTIAYLSGHWPSEIGAVRGGLVTLFAALLALGAGRGRDELRFRPSRAVTFQTFSLLVIGSYLVLMVTAAKWLAFIGGDFAGLLESSLLVGGAVLAAMLVPSRRLRGWLRVTLTKHFFQHRYDYRAEWLRFTRTIGRGGEGARPLHDRVVQAVADIADCPGGLLLSADDSGELSLAAHWQWPTADVPACALDAAGVTFLETHGFIIDIEDVRQGVDEKGEAAIVPAWLLDDPRAWAMVPLLHYDRLVGAVVLARPLHARKLDWEDFDLLRVVGQQLASYLAEQGVQEALAESSRFDDFHRRIAFVMHDIKNLASQFSLLARNAERHADNPEFRADMLVTLRNSADKLNALIARLSRYGGNSVEQLGEVRADKIAALVAKQFAGRHPVMLAQSQECTISANAESLEQVLLHLVQNAVDASAPETPVFINVTGDGMHGRIEVIDSGTGMSPEFVRTRLFKPFVSSKPGGFGIGAYEARELVQAMRGRLDVESREGLGSRFVVRLPLFAASGLIDTLDTQSQKVA